MDTGLSGSRWIPDLCLRGTLTPTARYEGPPVKPRLWELELITIFYTLGIGRGPPTPVPRVRTEESNAAADGGHRATVRADLQLHRSVVGFSCWHRPPNVAWRRPCPRRKLKKE